jgi:hypothetical protein
MSISAQQMADRVAELMEARLRIKGEGLRAKVRRGGRYLPRKVLVSAQFLAEAAEQSNVPKLLAQVDPEKTAEAYDTCVQFLKPLDAGARRRTLMLGIARSVAAAVVLTAALVLVVLTWRGYI